jgi:hypothetical protein
LARNDVERTGAANADLPAAPTGGRKAAKQ